jgi:hypothetical protein
MEIQTAYGRFILEELNYSDNAGALTSMLIFLKETLGLYDEYVEVHR